MAMIAMIQIEMMAGVRNFSGSRLREYAAPTMSEYITMMIKDHQKDLKEFQSEAQAAQNPTVKQIADKGSQVIQQHLQIIEQIAKAHNIDVGGKEMSSTK